MIEPSFWTALVTAQIFMFCVVGLVWLLRMLPRPEPGDEVEVVVVNDRAEIIERCARVADDHANASRWAHAPQATEAATQIAAAIRALAKEPQ